MYGRTVIDVFWYVRIHLDEQYIDGPEHSFQVDNSNLSNDLNEITGGYHLAQNYPNPFNPLTTIAFSIPETAAISLNIFNMQGQLVTTLIPGDLPFSVGYHSLQWDASGHPSGIYLVRLQAGRITLQCKMLLLK